MGKGTVIAICKVPTKLKGKLYHIAIQLYPGTDGECWAFKGITRKKASIG